MLAYLLLLPLLAVSRRAEQLPNGAPSDLAEPVRADTPRGLATASTSGIPSPQELGYSGVILQQLAQHARTVLGVHRAWIAVSPPGVEDGYTGVAAAGTDSDVIGTWYSAPCELGGLASAPVTVGAEPRGALCVDDPVNGGRLKPLDFALLAEVAALTGDVLTHHDRRQLASADSRAEISALVAALSKADGATYRHSLEVAATARAVGTRLGLTDLDLGGGGAGSAASRRGQAAAAASNPAQGRAARRGRAPMVRLHPEWGADMVARVPGSRRWR